MSRFANPAATERFILPGGCQCPGSPHDEDWMSVRTELGTADIVALERAESVDRLLLLVTEWNLLDEDGTAAVVDAEHVGLLFAESFDALGEWVGEHVRARTLPNASGAPSVSGSRASASSTRRSRKRR